MSGPKYSIDRDDDEGGSILPTLLPILIAAVLTMGLVILVQPRAHPAVTDLTECRFSIFQTYSVQWSITGTDPDTVINISNTDLPYASTAPAGQLDVATVDILDTYGFFPSETVPGTYGLKQYDAYGNLKRVMHDTGTFRAASDSMLLYQGAGANDTFFSTQAALDFGVSGTYPVTSQFLTNEQASQFTACSTDPILPPNTPAIALTSITGDIAEVTRAGQVITFSYLLTNAGTIDWDTPVVTDPDSKVTVTCPADVVAPGGTTTCTGTYLVTQQDIDTTLAIQVRGVATASVAEIGAPPSPVQVGQVPIAGTSSLMVIADPVADMNSGDQATLSFIVINTGNQTLSPIEMLADPATITPPGSAPLDISAFTCQLSTLPPGAGTPCSATFTATSGGDVSITAKAQGYNGLEEQAVGSAEVTFTVTEVIPKLSMTRSASPTTAKAGDVVTFSYLVSNTGNDTADSVTVTDDLAGLSAVDCPSGPLVPEDSITCTASYTVTAADATVGSLTSTATAFGGWGEVGVASDGVVLALTIEAAPEPTVSATPSPSTSPSVSPTTTASPVSPTSPSATPNTTPVANAGGPAAAVLVTGLSIGLIGALIVSRRTFLGRRTGSHK